MKLFVEQTKTTPKVDFDNEKNIFTLSGRSLSSNAASFFEPIIEWLEKNVKGEITLEVNLEYFNTSTHKHLYNLFNRLKLNNSENVICWYFEEEDEEMLEVGQKLELLSGAKFIYKSF